MTGLDLDSHLKQSFCFLFFFATAQQFSDLQVYCIDSLEIDVLKHRREPKLVFIFSS